MKKAIYILSALAIMLCAWLIVLWLPDFTDDGKPVDETRYGVSEGLELVEQSFADKSKKYVVEDGRGNVMFVVPLCGCIIDTRYRDGRLRFREQGSRREGYIDRQGIVTFLNEAKATVPEQTATGTSVTFVTNSTSAQEQQIGHNDAQPTNAGTPRRQYIAHVSLKSMAQSNPFYKEAEKIVQGKLTEQDAQQRHMTLNYCEHLRTTYTRDRRTETACGAEIRQGLEHNDRL